MKKWLNFKKIGLALGVFLVLSGIPSALAEEWGGDLNAEWDVRTLGDKPCEGMECKPRPLCFNVFCEYARKRGSEHGYDRCKSGAVFIKNVSEAGKEISDRSQGQHHPAFEVECDQRKIFSSSAYRYTDYLGTRIQAQSGPYPATVIPRGALSEGHRYVESVLELNGQVLEGFCYLYTGPQ